MAVYGESGESQAKRLLSLVSRTCVTLFVNKMATTVAIQRVRSAFLKPLSLKPLNFKTRPLCSGSISSKEWQDILDYWFAPGAQDKWFHGGAQVDQEIQEKFGFMVGKAIRGDLNEWENKPRPSLALIILTDQFTRSIFRNTAKAFSGDVIARSIAGKFIEGRTHNHLEHPYAERSFIYLPFEHSENIEDQEMSVNLVSKLVEDFRGTEHEEIAKLNLEFAIRHKEVIDMFGRYPQRNKALGRNNTPKEEEFLKNIPDHYKW